MGRPIKGYVNAQGEKLSGVTTILSRWKESGGLIHWAWSLGMEGKDYRAVRDKAADAGTIAHDMIEADLYGLALDTAKLDAGLVKMATPAFEAYLKWKDMTKLEVVESELPLVSEWHQFGGTLDAVGRIGQDLILLDWKTSNAVYQDYLLQGAAYHLLWMENFPDRPLSGGFHLLRFSKQERPDDPITFAHHHWSDLKLAQEQFLLLRKAYENDKRLKKFV